MILLEIAVIFSLWLKLKCKSSIVNHEVNNSFFFFFHKGFYQQRELNTVHHYFPGIFFTFPHPLTSFSLFQYFSFLLSWIRQMSPDLYFPLYPSYLLQLCPYTIQKCILRNSCKHGNVSFPYFLLQLFFFFLTNPSFIVTVIPSNIVHTNFCCCLKSVKHPCYLAQLLLIYRHKAIKLWLSTSRLHSPWYYRDSITYSFCFRNIRFL